MAEMTEMTAAGPGRAAALTRLARAVRPLAVAQALAGLAAGVRLVRGRDRLPPLTAGRWDGPGAARRPVISVIVPARNEAHRLRHCLAAALTDPAVAEVIVVDAGSTDGTARVAADLGARVVVGTPPPPGWAARPWALHRGLAAAEGELAVVLDAAARPRPGLFGALAAGLDGCDLLSTGPRFVCDGPAEQALHASFLATLVYRLGPSGAAAAPSGHRALAAGRCLAFRRAAMRAADGFALVRGRPDAEVALARALAARGWTVRFRDAAELLEVDVPGSVAGVWRERGGALPLRDVTGPLRLAGDLAVVWLAMALPVLRLATGRAGRLDLGLLALRLLLAGALRDSYTRPRRGVLLSPLLDPLAAVRLTQAALRPARPRR